MAEQLLSVRDLKVWFPVRLGIVGALRGEETKNVKAVDGIEFKVDRGQVYCLVGESGCGKTTTGKAILRLNDATEGNLLYRVPTEESERLDRIEARLKEIARPEPANLHGRAQAARTPAQEAEQALAEEAPRRLRKLQRLKTQALEALYPWRSVSLQLRREKAERMMAYLQDQIRGLKRGADPTVVRIMSRKEQELATFEKRGPGYTPKRVRRSVRIDRELKDARYAVRRAESTKVGMRKARQKLRSVERRLRSLQAKVRRDGTIDAKDIADRRRRIDALGRLREEAEAAQSRMSAAEKAHTATKEMLGAAGRADRKFRSLRRRILHDRPAIPEELALRRNALAARKKHITEVELEMVRDELWTWHVHLESLMKEQSQAVARAERALPEIEAAMTALRAEGGAPLETLELQALRDDIIRRHDLTQWSREQTAELRKHMQIIYQDPYESLNPKMSIFDTVSEPLLANKIVDTPAQAEILVRKALEDVGLKPAEEYMFRYPHELSGGQRQRVGIATALVVGPDFIMADEPVSMLDASVRTEILALLLDLKKRKNLTYLFITHDLGLAWIIADKIAVMYLGKIVERGDGPVVIKEPQHPYTKSLISVVPSPNPEIRREKIILKGERPNPVDIPAGCRFHPRCPNAVGVCGWDAGEVKEELTRLLQEDETSFPEARGAGPIAPDNSLELLVTTSDAEAFGGYLRQRVQDMGLTRPPIGAIRAITPEDGHVRLVLREPKEPELRPTPNGALVACLLDHSAAG